MQWSTSRMMGVVLYLISSSNHNLLVLGSVIENVVLYLISSSNHNKSRSFQVRSSVVLYLISSSNHNTGLARLDCSWVVLYLISSSNHNAHSIQRFEECCSLSHFIIKPQHAYVQPFGGRVVLYLISSSNHNVCQICTIASTLFFISFHHQTTTLSTLSFL